MERLSFGRALSNHSVCCVCVAAADAVQLAHILRPSRRASTNDQQLPNPMVQLAVMIYIGKNPPSAGQALIQDGISRWFYQQCCKRPGKQYDTSVQSSSQRSNICWASASQRRYMYIYPSLPLRHCDFPVQAGTAEGRGLLVTAQHQCRSDGSSRS